MGYKSDIEIAQETVMEPITDIAEKAGIDPTNIWSSTVSTRQKSTTIC